MALSVKCKCGAAFGAPESLAGKRARCPKCGEIIDIAKPSSSRSGSSESRNTDRKPSVAKSNSSTSRRRAKQPTHATPASVELSSTNDVFGMEDLSGLEQDHDPLGIANTPVTKPDAPQHGHSPHSHPVPASSNNKSLLILVGGIGVVCVLLILVIGIGALFMLSGSNGKGGKQELADSSSNQGSNYQPQERPNAYGSGQSASSILPSDQNSNPYGGSNSYNSGAANSYSGNSSTGEFGSGPANSAGPRGNRNGEFGSSSGSNNTNAFGSDPDPSDSETQSNEVESQPVNSRKAMSMVDATLDWHTKGNQDLVGAREVEDHELVIYHYSWMTELLPSLGHQDLYDELDFSTTFVEGENQLVARRVISQFLNPSDDRKVCKDIRFPMFGMTHFAGMSGVEDRPNDLAAELPRSDPRAGIFGYQEIAKPNQIIDGTSNTIMLIGTGRIVQPWIVGGGATIRGAREPYFGKNNGFGSKGLDDPGVIVVMADGSIRTIGSDIDPSTFRALCTIRGAETVDLKSSGIGETRDDWFK